MKYLSRATFFALLFPALSGCASLRWHDQTRPAIPMTDFESGWPQGWTHDPNWRLDDNSAGGWYQGWQGKQFAWSGQGGESATGTLRSDPFVLEREAVEVWVAGWADLWGQSGDRWDYVRLILEDGTELDRQYAPNTTRFTPLFLNGQDHERERMILEVVDDATEKTFSMICIDSLCQRDFPPLPALPRVKRGHGPALEDAFYRVEFDPGNGAITRLRDVQGHVELIHEPRLADNFRFTLPLPGDAAWQATEANLILGRDQRLSRVDAKDHELVLHWKAPLVSVFGQSYDVDVEMDVTLLHEQVEFRVQIDNRTSYPIGEVYAPVLGGLLGISSEDKAAYANPKDTELLLPMGAGLLSDRIFKSFSNQSPFGVLSPEQHYGYPDQLSMPWVDLYHPRLKRGLYVAAQDPVFRYKVIHLEMQPGISGPRSEGNWPRPEDLKGMPAGVSLSIAHMTYQPGGTLFEASPVVIKSHAGGWEEAAHLYGTWMKDTTPLPEAKTAPSWLSCDARDPRAMSQAVTDALAQGRQAILLQNWKKDADGTGVPWFEVAPELTQALRQTVDVCHANGLQVLFDIALEPARLNQGSPHKTPVWQAFSSLRVSPPLMDPEIEKSLSQFIGCDRWQIPHTEVGWARGRSHSEFLATTERRSVLNPGLSEYRGILVSQTRALAELGADGIHVGRFFARPLDFNPGTDLTPDQVTWRGGLSTLSAMLAAGRDKNPDFMLFSDTPSDWLLTVTPFSGREAPARSPLRAAFPGWQPLEGK